MQQLVDTSSTISEAEAMQDIGPNTSLDDGIKRIRKLDLILQKKLKQARDLSQSRQLQPMTPLSATSTPRSAQRTSPVESMNTTTTTTTSMDSNSHVLITQKESLETKPTKKKKETPKTISNFIQRNIYMGASARFFTLTAEEEARVEQILTDPIYELPVCNPFVANM